MAQKSYQSLLDSAIIVQTGMRAMTAHNEFKFRKQAKAAIRIQVQFTLNGKPNKIFTSLSY